MKGDCTDAWGQIVAGVGMLIYVCILSNWVSWKAPIPTTNLVWQRDDANSRLGINASADACGDPYNHACSAYMADRP